MLTATLFRGTPSATCLFVRVAFSLSRSVSKPVVIVRKIVHQDDNLGVFHCERQRLHLGRVVPLRVQELAG
jgi:hypothetical protein